MATLKAGAATVDITPPIGVDLCGYGARTGPSEGIHDPLRARALYLNCGGQALIVTSDLIGLDYASVAAIRESITEATGLSADQIMVSCSHTHSGPATPCLPTLGRVDPDYMALLLRKLASVGQMAVEQAAPAWAGHNREPVSVGFNRREKPWPKMGECAAEKGTVAAAVDTLTVNSADGPLARLFVHAAHAVTLGSDNLLISADWPGYAQRFLESLEPGAIAMFGQGCCGNINSDPRGTFEIAQSQGRTVAGAVMKAVELSHMRNDTQVATAREQFTLPCADPPPVEEARTILEQVQEQLQDAREQDNYGMIMMYEGMVQWARWLLKMAQKQATGLAIDYEVQAIRVGDWALVGLPGELFVEYALNIDARSPFQETAVIAYTNGVPGYIPTADAFAMGGYEVEGAYRFYCGGYTMLKPECEALILDAAGRLLARLTQEGTR
jgi:neutral ceramidase